MDELPETLTDRSGAERRFAELSALSRERARRYIGLRLGAALRRRVESEDVLQEVLLEASRLFLAGQAGEFPDEEGFFTWLSRIIDHQIKTLVRHHLAAQCRSVHREVRLDSDESCQPAGPGESPSTELLKLEGRESVRNAIRQLPAREREVIELVHFEKLRVLDAAERLGTTPNATSVLLHHALKRLGGILKRKERP